jgi:integrase
MSLKGTITTTDYLPFEPTVRTFKELCNQKNVFGLYGLISLYSGLRIGDVLKLKFEDLETDLITLVETKTNKTRQITIHSDIKEALKNFDRSGFIFISQKGSIFTRQQINRKLKSLFNEFYPGLNISSHSLRKSFGRRVYNNDNQSERALMMLSEIFNHSSIATTRKYIGIRKEEISNIYLNL